MNEAPTDTLDHATRLLKACADPLRLRLLNLLADGREVCVCHLHETLGLPQPTVSRHLASLRKAGLVAGRKDGLWVHYRLARPAGALHRGLIEALARGLAPVEILRDDRRRLDRIAGRCDPSPP